MTKWKRKHILYLIVIILGQIMLWYYGSEFMLSPHREKLNETKRTLNYYDQLIHTDQANQTATDWVEVAESIQYQLPTEQNIDQVLIAINSLEEDQDVTIQQIMKLTDDSSFAELSSYPESINQVQYQLIFKAQSSQAFRDFIFQLDQIERHTEITQLDYQQISDNLIEGNVTIRIFYNENVLIN
ncbi:hypothetical protein [Amphibacillus sediminis]|uniref:hypothetical protein n=1 Tax=Amphibacillus sediminis TaxID=360185 RepID=UPI00146FFC52|nr:hypothetical protein [Amphibacillus sediminis]